MLCIDSNHLQPQQWRDGVKIFECKCNLYSELQGNYTGNLNYPNDDLQFVCSNGFYALLKQNAVRLDMFY